MYYVDIVNKIKYLASAPKEGVSFPYLSRLNNFTGNIVKSNLTIISGDASIGKSEFMDFHYLYNILMTWHKSTNRVPIKILYFSTKVSKEVKYLKLISSYMWLNKKIRVDVPTLLNRVNKKSPNLTEVYTALDEAKPFFTDIEGEQVLNIYDKDITVDSIKTAIFDYMQSIGTITDTEFIPNDGYENNLLYIFIDGVDDISTYAEGSGYLSKKDTMARLQGDMSHYKRTFESSIIITAEEIDKPYKKGIKDYLPSHRSLGTWLKSCDIGIVIHDPIKEDTLKILLPESADEALFVTKGVSIIKYWFVVKNTNGADLAFERMISLPGSNISIEHSRDNAIANLNDTLTVLYNMTNKYI